MGNHWLSMMKVPIRGSINQTEVVYSYQKCTRLPHPKVDTEPIEFCIAKLLLCGGNCPIHNVQSPFTHFLQGILEVDYERFCVHDKDIEYSGPTMNHASVMNPINCIDNVLPEARRL